MRWALTVLLLPLFAQDNHSLALLDLAVRKAEVQGDAGAVQAQLRKFLEASRSASDGEYSTAVVRLAAAYFSQGEIRKGREVLDSEIEHGFRQGGSSWARLFQLLETATSHLPPRQAEAAWQRLCNLTPPRPTPPEISVPLAQLRYAEALAENGKPDDAAVVMERAVRETSGVAHQTRALFRLWTHYREYGQEAQEVESRIVEAAGLNDPNPNMETVMSWSDIATMWQRSGRDAEAETLRNRIQEFGMRLARQRETILPPRPVLQDPRPEQTEETRIIMREGPEVYLLEQKQRATAQAAETSAREWANQARDYIRARQLAQAEEALGRILALADKQSGTAADPRYIDLIGAANEYIMVNRRDQAMAWNERVVDSARRKFPPAYPALHRLMERLASDYVEAERWDDAESLYHEILRSVETAGGNPAPMLGTLGRLRTARCKCSDGLVLLRQALAATEERNGPLHSNLIDPLLYVAAASDALKVPEAEARAPLERAWTIAQKLPAADVVQQDSRRAEVLASLALHWFERNRPEEIDALRVMSRRVGCEVEFLRRYSIVLSSHGDKQESERIGRLYDGAAQAQYPLPQGRL